MKSTLWALECTDALNVWYIKITLIIFIVFVHDRLVGVEMLESVYLQPERSLRPKLFVYYYPLSIPPRSFYNQVSNHRIILVRRLAGGWRSKRSWWLDVICGCCGRLQSVQHLDLHLHLHYSFSHNLMINIYCQTYLLDIYLRYLQISSPHCAWANCQ